MNCSSMQESHAIAPHATAPGRPWLWTLPARQARRLAAAPHPRWLLVECGRVWLTRSGHGPGDGDDVWLGTGERHWLPAGSEWVAEGWPEARWALMEAPHGAQDAPFEAGRSAAAALRRVLQRWLSGVAQPA